MIRLFFLPVLLFFSPVLLFCTDHQVMSSSNASEPDYTVAYLEPTEWLSRIPREAEVHTFPEKRYPESFDTDLYLSITIHSMSDQELWFLDFLSPFEWISIHYRVSDGEWVSQKTGDLVAMNDREIQHRTQVFSVPLERDMTLYLHLLDYQKKAPDFRILSPKAFIAVNERKDGLLIFGLSLVLFTCIYNFSRFILDRNRNYLYYGIVLFSELVANLGKLRLYSFLFVPQQPYGYFLYIFCNSIAVIAAVSFSLSFFEIPKKSYFSRILRTLRTLLWPVAIISVIYPNPIIGDVMNLIIVPTLVLILGMTVMKSFKGDLSSRLILISFLPLLLGVLWENINIYMDYDKFHSLNLTQIVVIFIHIVFMSLGNARKDSELKKSYQILKDNFSEKVSHEVYVRTREIESLASMDGLTGLLNRTSLDKSIGIIESNVTDYSPLGVVFLDLDNFKYYNDNLGHAAGDLILVKTARLLSSVTRHSDLIYRYGGDEFLILMPQTDLSITETLSRRIHAEFQDLAENMIDSPTDEQRLGLSLGISVWSPENNSSLRDSISLADEALLKVKKEGKNRVMSFAGNQSL